MRYESKLKIYVCSGDEFVSLLSRFFVDEFGTQGEQAHIIREKLQVNYLEKLIF